MEIDKHTQCVYLPRKFCKIAASKDELINKVFSNITQNYKNHEWFSARAIILAVKNNDVNVINFCNHNTIPCEAITYQSTVVNQDEVINYPTEF